MTYIKEVALTAPVSSFGELLEAQLDPAIQAVFPYALNAEKATAANSGAGSGVTWATGLISIASGTANNGYATLTSKQVVRYGAGQGVDVRFAGMFGTPDANNTQVMGVGDATDGFFFGYNGTTFGVSRRKGGSDNWVAQASWNVDPMTGSGPSGQTLTQTNGNVYRIVFQWLGFGMITFMVENASTGAFQVVHRIAYANANTATSIANPTLPFFAASINGAAGTTSCTIKTGSFSAFVAGRTESIPYVRFATGAGVTNVTTEAAIFTLKNKATNVLGGTNTNRSPIMVDWISAAAEGTKPAVIRAVLNTTLGGAPSYADISTNTSIVQKDTAGTTVTGGTERWSASLGKSANVQASVDNLKIMLYPGDTLTLSGQSAANSDIYIRVGWRELT